jgi:hypothetical protein
MALTDIVAPPGNSSTLTFSRGDIGTLEDIQAVDENMFYIPEATGAPSSGNIFIMSE